MNAAAAVALPDDYLGEKICAAVVFSGTAITLAETIRHQLDTHPDLDGTCLDLVGPNGGSVDISGPDALFIGGDVLCWGITLRFTSYEIDEVVPA